MSLVTVSRATKSEGHRWIYEATLDEKTGDLIHIKAGCRRWQTFEQARGHYVGTHQEFTTKWTDSHIDDHLNQAYMGQARGDTFATFKSRVIFWRRHMDWRRESLDVLTDLEAAVRRKQDAIHNAHKRKRKPAPNKRKSVRKPARKVARKKAHR